MGQTRSRYRSSIQDQLHSTPEIRLLTRDDENDALQILYKAFENDDAFLWTVRDENLSEAEAKARAVHTTRYALQWSLSAALMSGFVLGIFEDDTVLIGVLVAYPPNSSPSGSFLSYIYNSITFGESPTDLYCREWGMKPKIRDQAWETFSESHHETVMGGRPHWYVALLGVNPRFQGCGYGKRLLSVILRAADATEHPTYLETESAFNETIYHKYGFQTLEKADIRTSDPTIQPFSSLYLMAREFDASRSQSPKFKKTLEGVLPIGTSSSTILLARTSKLPTAQSPRVATPAH